MDSGKEMYVTTEELRVNEYIPTLKSGRFKIKTQSDILGLDANTMIQVTSKQGDTCYGNVIDGDKRIHIVFNKDAINSMKRIDTKEYIKFKSLLELYKREYEFENVKLENPRVPQEASASKVRKSRSSKTSGGRKTSKKRK